MERFKLAAFLLALPASGLADRAVVATEGVAPGTYQGPGYTTKFDRDGRWETSNGGFVGGGRYALDGDVVIFMMKPQACPDERVRYRVMPTAKGFRLHFLEDSCGRVSQMEDIEFVRVR